MSEATGPIGFQFIESAPRDGSLIRLRFRERAIPSDDGDIVLGTQGEVIGHWQDHAEMKTGGSWFDIDGNYLGNPIYWAPRAASKTGAE